MEAVILECPKRARFHFGKIALDNNTSLEDTDISPRSDTLFSAMMVTAAQLFEKEQEVNAFADLFEKGVIRHSSAFFCLEIDRKADRWIFFLPKPPSCDLWPADDYKKARKIQYLSKEVWESGLKPDQWLTDCVIIDRKFVVTKAEAELLGPTFQQKDKAAIYETNTLPKVAVHVLDQENGFFHQTSVQLCTHPTGSPSVHYYFLMDTSLQGKDRHRLDMVLQVMADNGIGGERFVGCGRLRSIITGIPFDWKIENPEQFVSLSLINPGEDELTNCHYYKTILRGGRPTRNDGILERVRMLQEGAVIDNKVSGQLVDISTGTGKYLRCGKSLIAPLHKNLQ
jgi:CRISPR-associated protein Csm4